METAASSAPNGATQKKKEVFGQGGGAAGGAGSGKMSPRGPGFHGGGSSAPSMVLKDVVPRALDIQRRTATLWSATDLQSAKALNSMLERTYLCLQPSPVHHETRLQLLQRLNNLVQPIAPGSQVVIFGSFETNVYTPTGDLDLSIVLPESGVVRYQREEVEIRKGPVSKTQRVKILRIVKKLFLLTRGAFSHMELVAGARVPVLNFIDNVTRVHCDLSINNDGALFKSRVLRWVLELDDRCRPLVYLVKAWARAQLINDSRNGTINSYALSLLVVFHLQTRSPPILPSFQTILSPEYHELRKGFDISELRVTEGQLQQCHMRVLAFKAEQEQIGREYKNKSSLAELLASFFAQYAGVETLWPHGLTVSPWLGTWKEAREVHTAWYGKQYIMRVEDPFDLSENCARSVQPGRFGFLKICSAFREAALLLRTPLPPANHEQLKLTLFGRQLSPQPGGNVRNAVGADQRGPDRLGDWVPRFRAEGQSLNGPSQVSRQLNGGYHNAGFNGASAGADEPGSWTSRFRVEGQSHASPNGQANQVSEGAEALKRPIPQQNHAQAMLAALQAKPGHEQGSVSAPPFPAHLALQLLHPPQGHQVSDTPSQEHSDTPPGETSIDRHPSPSPAEQPQPALLPNPAPLAPFPSRDLPQTQPPLLHKPPGSAYYNPHHAGQSAPPLLQPPPLSSYAYPYDPKAALDPSAPHENPAPSSSQGQQPYSHPPSGGSSGNWYQQQAGPNGVYSQSPHSSRHWHSNQQRAYSHQNPPIGYGNQPQSGPHDGQLHQRQPVAGSQIGEGRSALPQSAFRAGAGESSRHVVDARAVALPNSQSRARAIYGYRVVNAASSPQQRDRPEATGGGAAECF